MYYNTTEGDQLPPECKGPDTDISLLISRSYTSCVSRTLMYYQVPTSLSGSNDSAYVDLS